ncbi:F0F1 ATP synthase subunit alpha [Candidatus Roizmanbacteria bacterium]|nr:F0F1 ATP synthase subunit alpha [Candidatus Roizmanbacteria bacterium]
MKLLDQYLKELETELSKPKKKTAVQETGAVTQVKDGVAILSGLDNVGYGEIIYFTNGLRAYVIDLLEDEVGAIVLGDYLKLKHGDTARGSGETLSVGVADEIIGRVVDPLGRPLDGKGKMKAKKSYPLEKIAPGVVSRQPVTTSLHTGIKAVDALIPIGRGQRELIMGDRGTGKTTIALDTVLAQKNEGVIAVYCAIGQKSSKIAATMALLQKNNAFDYTVVVAATSSDPASVQYLAPYGACAIAEYFMDQGKDVVIVYDDLSKHAWAYREISLILRRPAGREAYPGDVFYLHSRLLERACRLNDKLGGGSITALPIIETLEGDLSAYIPTNVISITDGQLALDADLFNSGNRPAINVGLSVSRVGGNAQTKAMKKVAGRLKLDLAQYRDMAAFSQFESDLDPETKKLLSRGARLTQILRQKKNVPYDLSQEVAIIWAASGGYLDEVPLDKIEEFENRYLQDLRSRGKKLLLKINKNKLLDESDEKELKKFVSDNLFL